MATSVSITSGYIIPELNSGVNITYGGGPAAPTTDLTLVWQSILNTNSSTFSLGVENGYQDISINNIWTKIGYIDTSLNALGVKNANQDSSLLALGVKNANQDSSLITLGSQVITVTNQGNDRILTSTATNNTINGEANLTWNTNSLDITGGTAQALIIRKLQTTSASTGTYMGLYGGAAGTTGRGYIGYTSTELGANTLFSPEIKDAIGIRGESAIQFGISSSPKVAITTMGMGITTPSPSANLHISSTGAVYTTTPSMIISDTTNRATLIMNSETDNPVDFIHKVDGSLRWSMSTRGSTQGHNLHFYGTTDAGVFNGPWFIINRLTGKSGFSYGAMEPSARMHIYENGTGNFTSLLLDRTTANVDDEQLIKFKSSTLEAAAIGAVIKSSTDADLVFKTNTSGTTNLVERMRIDGDGLVGINIIPSYALDVSGVINARGLNLMRLSGNLSLPVMKFTTHLLTSGIGNHLAIGQTGGADLIFLTNNTERVRITDSGGYTLDVSGTGRFRNNLTLDSSLTVAGKVGIGTTNPHLPLSVLGAQSYPATSGSTQTGAARIGYVAGNGVLDIGQNLTFGWLQSTNAADLSQTYEILLNPNGGNVGVNTYNSAYSLDVSGTGHFKQTVTLDSSITVAGTTTTDALKVSTEYAVSNQGVTTWGSTANQGYLSWDTGKVMIGGQTSNALTLQAGGAEKIRVTVDGSVGFGTTTPQSRISIAVGATNNFKALSFAETTDNFWFEGNFAGTGLTGNWLTLKDYSLHDNMTWLANGNVGIMNPAPSYTLDVSGTGRFTGRLGVDSSLHIKTSSFDQLFIERTSGAVGTYRLGVSYANNAFTIYDAVNSQVRIGIDTNGAVGLGGITPVSPYSAILDVSGNGLFRSNLIINSSLWVKNSIVLDGSIGTNAFSEGFYGSGWRINQPATESTLTVDNLNVRKLLKVYELQINKIRAVGGSLIVSAANGTPYSVSGTRFYFDSNNNANPIQFAVNDYIAAQTWLGTGGSSYRGRVTAVNQSATYGSAYIDASTISGTAWSGMELVQIGNSTNTARQNLLEITSANGQLHFAGYSGVTDGVFTGHERFRFGNLVGITSPTFGTLNSSSGLWANDVYLEGAINASSGYIGGFTISNSEGLYSGTGATRVQMRPGSGIWCGSTSLAASPFSVSNSGHLVSRDACIGGWIVDGSALYSGTRQSGNGYSTSGITISSNGGIHSKNFFINSDGSVGLRGTLNAVDGSIAGWIINSDALYTGTKKTTSGYTTTGITLASNGSIRAPFFEIDASGYAHFESVDSVFYASTPADAGNLRGTVYAKQANIDPSARQDRIDFMLGTNGTANIGCEGVQKLFTFSGNFATSIDNFISANQSYYSAVEVNLSRVSNSLVFEAAIPGTDFTVNNTYINFLTGDLDADVVAPARVNYLGQKRIDYIYLDGSFGTAIITCDGHQPVLEYNTSLTVSASDFISTYSALYEYNDIILSQDASIIIFTADSSGVNFTGTTSIVNIPYIYRGAIKIQNNAIWENTQTDPSYGWLTINKKGYNNTTQYYRHLYIGNGKGVPMMTFEGGPYGAGHKTGYISTYAEIEFNSYARFWGNANFYNPVYIKSSFNMTNLQNSSVGLLTGDLYKDSNGYVRIKV